MQDIELARISQEVAERFYNLLAVGKDSRCLSRVKMRRTRIEHMSAGLPLITDIALRGWHGRKVP